MSAAEDKAVFLSYASQDAEAARRICDALRAAGVEVWFDQSELRGGDAWDAKIRKQIKECALFVPVISANTQARLEGYFRIEWRLAAQRTHAMAEEKAFLFPVVIDDTSDGHAVVPAEFKAVQWTRIQAEPALEAFCSRVKVLLDGEMASRSARERSGLGDKSPAVPLPVRPRRRPFLPWLGTAVLIGAGAAVRWLWPNSTGSAAVVAPSAASPVAELKGKSIAVLPFENLSPEREAEFFADGMHDEVITSLVKIRDLTVISRASVMQYRKTASRSLQTIASELGVANVLEGRVRRAGNQVKVTVELIDGRTGKLRWAHPYTKDVTDVFAIQSELAEAITSALKATFSREEKTLIARRPTQNQAAYDLYLRARARGEMSSDLDTRENVEAEIALYEQAIAKDPAFSLAHVQLCFAHGRLYWYGYLDPSPARRSRARAALDAALALAPDEPETRLAAGFYAYLCENDWARALTEFRAAAEALPNDAQAIAYSAFSLRRLGRLSDSVDYLARAIELNPHERTWPSNQIATLLQLRRFGAARDRGEQYQVRHADDPSLRNNLLMAQLELDHDAAGYLRNVAMSPNFVTDPHRLIKAYLLATFRGDWRAAGRALADPRLTYIPGTGGIINEPVSLHRALVAFVRGDPDEARTFADQSIAELSGEQWASRQQPAAMMATALAHALAGRSDKAVSLGREALTLQRARDAYDFNRLRPGLGGIYVVLDRKDDALAILREMMAEPCDFGPEMLRLTPLWARLKSDPRFETVLKSAKPL